MLALVAGSGVLPGHVARRQPEKPLICVLDGNAPQDLEADVTFRLENFGTLLSDLAATGVTQVCFCGAIKRPSFDPDMLATATRPLAPRLMKALEEGDDSALRLVMSLFEGHGMTILGVQDLVPDLLIGEGQMTATPLTPAMERDIARADAILAALAPLDVGQGCVVGGGQVWGIETVGGTDHMLLGLPPEVRFAEALLVKGPKQGQDIRIDLPTIGPDTIDAVMHAGLSGLVVAAGQTILLCRDETLARANEAGLVFWSRPGV
ncbi:MAG: UDP-2,3-diacylglucosamine diphosphatase LpxI [Roseobacter sp.]|jgi:DUF1009 family protein